MKTLTKITVHDYKSGKNIGACKMVKYAEYDTKHPQPADPGAVLAGDWLTPEPWAVCTCRPKRRFGLRKLDHLLLKNPPGMGGSANARGGQRVWMRALKPNPPASQ
jgi:hypothetical protein